ncbi:endonuclease/exonuclease/phosphatase family protein [Bacteroidota bacterium]
MESKEWKIILILLLFFGNLNQSNCQVVKLMTYNIRYDNAGDKENRWDLRKDYLTDQIKFHEPGILGIQEGLHHQVNYVDSCLTDYKFIGVGRNDGKTKGEYSAIFYKNKNYEIIKSSTFWLSETPEIISKGWDAALERICTYALFEDKNNKQKFWVFNTHFDHRGETARINSAKLIINKISELNINNYPVILMGDLNLESESQAIQYITKFLNDSKQSATRVTFGPNSTFNGFNFNYTEGKRIDYIFTSKKGILVNKYAVLTDSKDQKYPSDHFPVFVKIIFK